MSTSRYQGLGRREFLTTSACALATAAAGPKLFAGLTWQPRLIVTGFAPLGIESAGTDSFERNVVAAESIGRVDRAFLRHGALIAMRGVSGGDPRARRTIDFLAHYTYRDGGENRVVPFHAWAGHEGSPVRFTVPVDEQQKIRFSVTAPMPVAAEKGEASRRSFLRTDGEQRPTAEAALPVELALDGAMKLNRGFYIVVPLYDGDSAPYWSSYSLKNLGGRWTLTTRDGKPASFEHFVLRIDYAGAPRQPREARA